ncbi:MAG TPA: single-stranded-DNA-specific exonuclease RecJ [Geobacteraceae bacterium]
MERLAQEGKIPAALARILANRGISDPVQAERFLLATFADMHDPFLLSGMEKAVDRLAAAVRAGERLCVHGDYDVDGVTGVALLVAFFRTIGLDGVSYYIPRRLEEGYGLSTEGVRSVAASGAKIILTVDCGINSVAEAELCASMGIDLIITDHHMPGETIPPALAVINPLLPDSSFPFKNLAGVGVAFNLMIALRMRLREEGHFAKLPEPNLRECLDLVALGTVADIVPLVDENRIFVKCGLRELASSRRIGIQALKEVAGVSGDVSCGAVGFRLAPRLNAAGRLEDAALGVELLLCTDRQRAKAMAAELDASNAERQALEQEILAEALAMVRDIPEQEGRRSIVLASEAWHPGVIGIVASRIVDMFHRPTILIALQEGNGRGSGRSIPNFHLHDALNACSEHLLKFGGHKYAAGLSVEESTLRAFIGSFDEVATGLLSPADLIPELAIDAVLKPEEVSYGLAEAIEAMAPFGMGNPEPVFMLERARIAEQRILKERHLRLHIIAGKSNFEAIGFNMAQGRALPELVDLAFSLQLNEWNGRKSLQLRLRDIRDSENADIPS